MGSGNAGPQSGTTTTTYELNAPLKAYYQKEGQFYRPQVYRGQRLAAQSAPELQHIQKLTEFGNNPISSIYGRGERVANDLMTPFAESNYKNILDNTVANAATSIEERFSRAGRGGSPAFAKALGSGLTEAGHNVLRDYNRDRISAVNLGSGLANDRLAEIQARNAALGLAGNMQSDYDQLRVDTMREELDEENASERERISAITNLLTQGANPTQSYQSFRGGRGGSSRLVNLIGGAMAGSKFLGGPAGVGVGALLGALS